MVELPDGYIGVFWIDHDQTLVGRLVSDAGTPHGAAFEVSNTPVDGNFVASVTDDGGVLVVQRSISNSWDPFLFEITELDSSGNVIHQGVLHNGNDDLLVDEYDPAELELFRLGDGRYQMVYGGQYSEPTYEDGQVFSQTLKPREFELLTDEADSFVLTFGATQVDAGPGADSITGSETHDLILGFAGSDSLIGLAGNDTLDGEAENDTVDGGVGNDLVIGRSGDDHLMGSSGNDTLHGGEGLDTLDGGEGDDLIFGGDTLTDLSDTIFAGDGNDTVDGGHGNDLIYGQAGNDLIEGGFGVDEIYGQNGDDIITGSAWSDLVFGGAGSDFINGGYGHDRVNGGEGGDRFYHSGHTGHGSDWIQDFSSDEGDILLFGQPWNWVDRRSVTADDFLVAFAHTENELGERSGDDEIKEAFVTFIPSGQILWALVDGAAQTSLNLRIYEDPTLFDLLG